MRFTKNLPKIYHTRHIAILKRIQNTRLVLIEMQVLHKIQVTKNGFSSESHGIADRLQLQFCTPAVICSLQMLDLRKLK